MCRTFENTEAKNSERKSQYRVTIHGLNSIKFQILIVLDADFNTLPLPELHKQKLLLFTFKVMRQPYTLPSVFKNYFNINSNVHTHATRSRNNIHMNRQSTTYGQRCLKYKGACLWNNLPEYIKNQASFNELKAMLRQHLVNEHC